MSTRFFDATTYPSILLLEKQREKTSEVLETSEVLVATFTEPAQLRRLEDTIATYGFTMPVSALRPDGWNLKRPDVFALMEKLRKAGKTLGEYVDGKFYYGIKTGFGDAFVINEETKAKLINEDPKSEELINPWLKGRDNSKWKAIWAGLYLISIASSSNKEWAWSKEKDDEKARSVFKREFPAIHRHLSQWEDKLRDRDDQGKFWWELRSCAYWEEFGTPKVILGRFMNKAVFSFDKDSLLHNDAMYMIPNVDEYLVALLNSSASWWFLRNICTDLQNGYLQAYRENLFQIPIPPATDTQKAPIIELVQQILANPDNPDVPRLENEIDKLVYELYDLTKDEIALVERINQGSKIFNCNK